MTACLLSLRGVVAERVTAESSRGNLRRKTLGSLSPFPLASVERPYPSLLLARPHHVFTSAFTNLRRHYITTPRPRPRCGLLNVNSLLGIPTVFSVWREVGVAIKAGFCCLCASLLSVPVKSSLSPICVPSRGICGVFFRLRNRAGAASDRQRSASVNHAARSRYRVRLLVSGP